MKKKKLKTRIRQLENEIQVLKMLNKRLRYQLKLREYLDVKPRMPHIHEDCPYDNINKITCSYNR